MYLSDTYTIPVNLAGNTAISVPCGFGESGMPIGLQIIGDYLKRCSHAGLDRRGRLHLPDALIAGVPGAVAEVAV